MHVIEINGILKTKKKGCMQLARYFRNCTVMEA